MNIKQVVDLSTKTTMGVGGIADYFATVTNQQEVLDAISWASDKHLPVIVLGGGSNLLFSDGPIKALVIENQIRYTNIDERADGTLITAGSGVVWDDLVAQTVELDLTGIEGLSAIPGTVGAAPVQNINAYGQHIATTLSELRAIELKTGKLVTFSADECNFGYRTSRFKYDDRGKYFIYEVELKLSKGQMEPPFYRSLQDYLEANKITDRDPKTIRQAVIEIRKNRLPDPRLISNSGSFFKNPIVSTKQFESLRAEYPEIPGYPQQDGVKIPAGWLIEKAGLKGTHDECGFGTYQNHALVITNSGSKKFSELEHFYQQIQQKVRQVFKISLEIEPEIY